MIVILFLMEIAIGAVFAESNPLLYFYTELDWFSKQSSDEAPLPEGLTEHEAEIYRAAYANGHYDALHPAFIEGLYVLNTKPKVFHLSNCMNTLLILSGNRVHSDLSPEILMNEGYKGKKYKPCGACHPERQTSIE